VTVSVGIIVCGKLSQSLKNMVFLFRSSMERYGESDIRLLRYGFHFQWNKHKESHFTN